MTSTDFLIGLGVGLAVAAASYLTLRLLYARQLTREALAVPPRTAEFEPSAEAFPAPATTRPAELNGPNPSAAASAAVPPVAGYGEEDGLRLSRRVLLHLSRLGSPTPGASVSDEFTQRGMMARLGVTQGALANVLGRLEASGAIMSERAHVVNRERRVKVYLLTVRGRELAASLRSGSAPRKPAAPSPPSSLTKGTMHPAGRPPTVL